MAQNTNSPYRPEDDQKLMVELWDPALAEDLYKYVMFVYPWGKPNTPLANFKGPRTWQIDIMHQISDHIKRQKVRIHNKLDPEMLKIAVSSGRGIGKSTLVAMLNNWMLTTVLGSTVITTANTEAQLSSRTWAELGKWNTLAINSHWFEKTALSLRPAAWFEKALKSQMKIDTGYYYGQAQLWSEEKPDAFAGAHNMNGMMLLMDESSGIPKPIWDVSEGFFTEPVLHRYWFVFSNPRRNTGKFFECFHAERDYWLRRNIDSRTVEGTDKAVYEKIIKINGEDSDIARVEVKGEFPSQGDKQFISRSIVDGARDRKVEPDDYAALIMGVDVARFGNDNSVIRFRRGRDARSIPPVSRSKLDNMQLANLCAELIDRYNPDAVCIDAGNGTGVIDRLKEMGYRVHEVWFGSGSDDPEWANHRTQIWARMREWLAGGAIDDLKELADDLCGPEYDYQRNGDKQILEPKESMKTRGLASPDHGDALACTFSIKVARKDKAAYKGTRRNRVAADVNYKVFG